MIALNRASFRPRPSSAPGWHAAYLELLPAIQRQARLAFRILRPEERQDAITEVIAHTFCAYCRLLQLGKQRLAYATPLARFAVAHYWAGRRIGAALRKRNVLSQAQRQGRPVQSLDASHSHQDGWEAALADNTRSPVPDQVALRMDFRAWLASQSPRDRRLIRFLALGNQPAEAASRFGVSRARVSQLRDWLRHSWAAFQGEVAPPACAATA